MKIKVHFHKIFGDEHFKRANATKIFFQVFFKPTERNGKVFNQLNLHHETDSQI